MRYGACGGSVTPGRVLVQYPMLKSAPCVRSCPEARALHAPDALLHLCRGRQLAAAAGEGGGHGVSEPRQAPSHVGGLEGAGGGQ